MDNQSFYHRSVRKVLSNRARVIFTLTVWVLYVLGLLALYFILGTNANALAVLPVIISAWLLGKRAGFWIGLVAYPFNILFFWLLGYEYMDRMLALQALWPMIGMAVIGLCIGWASDTREELRQELENRQRAEAALVLSGKIMENLAEGIMLIRVNDGHIVYTNPRLEKMFGYESNDLIGKHVSLLIAPANQSPFVTVEAIIASLKKTGIWKGEVYNIQKDGTAFWCYASVSEFSHPDYGPVWVAVQNDISERKQVESQILALNTKLELRVEERTTELHSANLALEKALRLKDEFLASMSHELRTPLTGILGLSEVLQYQSYGALNEKQINALKQIESSGKRLLQLVNNILDLANIEAGGKTLQISPFSLADVCLGCLETIKKQAETKHQQTDFQMLPETIILRADAQRIRQIVIGLLDNAIKFTPDGGNLGIEIMGKRFEQVVEVTIWDSGIGIQVDDLPRLFQPFMQLDSRLGRLYNGAGLGLILAKRLAELHGGGIRVESIFGKGSRFVVSLPWVTEPETLEAG